MHGKERVTTSILLALLVEWIGLEIMRRIESLAPLFQYGMAVILGIASFIILYYGLHQVIGRKLAFLENRFWRIAITGGAFALNVFCICMASLRLSDRYPGSMTGILEQYPVFMIILVYTALFLLCGYICKNQNIREKGYTILAIFLGIFVVASAYVPNIFQYDPYHAPAYTNSIYNVLAGHPYDKVTQTIYGHYGIFYYLPMKILTIFLNRTTALYLLICLLTVLTWYCTVRVVHILVHNRGLQLIGLAALIWQFTRSISVYWAVRPHRLLFPSLLLLYCVKKKASARNWWGGWFICTFSLLWNLETGLTCTITYIGFNLIRTLQKDSCLSAAFFFQAVKQAFCAVGAFLCSYIAFNIYNLMSGGTWQDIMCYIYPIASSTYKLEGLNVPLPMVYNSYAVKILLFTAVFCYVLGRTAIFSQRKRETKHTNDCILIVLSLLGLGMIMYYINRAAVGNLWISYMPAMLLLILLCDGVLNRIDIRAVRKLSMDDTVLTAGAALAFSVMSVCAFLCMISVGEIWVSRGEFQSELTSLQGYADLLECTIPKDTYAVGNGVQELYGLLGWDPQCHTIDYSGIVPDGITYMQEELEEKNVDDVLCSKPLQERLLGDLPYEPCLEIVLEKDQPYGKFVYMVKKDQMDPNEIDDMKYAYDAWKLCNAVEAGHTDRATVKQVQKILKDENATALKKQLDLASDYSDTDYTRMLYECVFEREPTAREESYCLCRLASDITRAQLVFALMDSRTTGKFCDAGLDVAINYTGNTNVYAKESNNKGTVNWRWAEQSGTLDLYNYTYENMKVRLSGKICTNTEGDYTLKFTFGNGQKEYPLSDEPQEIELLIDLKPGSNVVSFETDAPYIDSGADIRNLCFRFIDLSLEEVKENGE